VLRFGTPGRGPKATVQAALHADEIPPLLVAQALKQRLQALERDGQIVGEVQLVPFANPVGLSQDLLGTPMGRFDLRDGVNFNRLHPDLADTVDRAVGAQLGTDGAANVQRIRTALREAVQALQAIDSDIVLDLHCDAQASMHLYALTPQVELAEELGALLGAEAVLLATESGDSPFDEACTRPWLVLQERHPQADVPLACFGATVELRGEADTSHLLAGQDADAIVEFLRRRGVVAGPAAPLPEPRCAPTPLSGSEPITAPAAGVVVFHREPGAWVEAGTVIADLVDIETGAVTHLACQGSGRLYARAATRWARPGKRLAKIAGTTLARTGKLLSP
jgi:predicted deacylase